MGLAGRKVKQRIVADPRNLSWADDASRFGQAYLSKFGWDASRGVGLGVSGEGMTSHLKVSQKLDILGIGAAHQRDPHGIAWKQNRDFEALLKRLNERADGDVSEDKDGGAVKEGGFVHATEGKSADEVIGEGDKSSKDKDKKRKRKGTDDGVAAEGDSKKKTKKRKHGDDSISEERGKDNLGDDTEETKNASASSPSETTVLAPKPKIKGRPMAHRARIQAAKSLANKSAAAISEILGIAPSPTPSSSLSTPGDKSPSATPHEPDPVSSKGSHTSLEKLTTSTKSVADYFKDKLAAKKSTLSTPPDICTSSTPRSIEDDCDTPRSGLGASRTSLLSRADEGHEKQQGHHGLGFISSIQSASTGLRFALPSTVSMAPDSITLNSSGEGSRGESKSAHDAKGKKKRKKDRTYTDA
ncbi:hypothetical protein V8B97DRAFT_456874 [Scleroderma yunnanense]